MLNDRLRALENCLERLAPADQELVRLRYQERADIDELVKRSGTSRRTFYRNLDRIRQLLFNCITRRLAATD